MKTLLVLGLAALGAAASAQTIAYDATAGTTSFFSASPQSARGADIFTTGDAGAGFQWSITQFKLSMVMRQIGTYARGYTIKIYDGVNAAATGTTPVFGSLLRSYSFAGSTTTTTANSASLFTTVAQTPLLLKSNATYGVQIEVKNGGVYDPNLLLGYKNAAPTAGTATNGFFWDTNNDGVITGSEATNGNGWTNGNLSFQALGSVQAVPEPGSMIALALGAGAMLRRRKRAA